MRWTCGVTTTTLSWTADGQVSVPSDRCRGLLPRTLASLKGAGFVVDRLFVDGADHHAALRYQEEFGIPVTSRHPSIRAYGNWILGLAELYIRNPICHRYAMFQDDLVCCRNLRAYLDRCQFPEQGSPQGRGYWNLYTTMLNQGLAPTDIHSPGAQRRGWFKSNQMGLGALALVFDRMGVIELLSRKHMAAKPAGHDRRSYSNIDGAVSDALVRGGEPVYTEWVHHPSLVQHTGDIGTMGNLTHAPSLSFLGEGWDAMEKVRG